jgi:putative methionine-R-sulfoxide reductase with GAF domain
LIAIPLFKAGRVYGVLDVDSPGFNRFSASEADVLTRTGGEISAFFSAPRFLEHVPLNGV